MESLSLELPNDIANRLRDLAMRSGRTEANLAMEAICQYIQDLEDLYVAEKRLEELNSGKTKPLSLDDLIDKYGIDC